MSVLQCMMLKERNRSTTWARLFATSHSEEDVVRIADDYLATWLPSDLEFLPAGCRFGALRSAEEVAQAAVMFTRFELHAVPGTTAAEILGLLTEVLIAAQVRVRQLRASRFDPTGR